MIRKTPDESALIATADYRRWILELRKRYRATQIKAAVSVNSALLDFYWNLGKDISEKYASTQFYGSRFFECVSKDLTDSIGNPKGLSVVNIRYSQRFYELYAGVRNLQQVVEELVQVPWGHHSRIIDNCKGDARKALFKHEWDAPTVGLVLCKSKDKTVVEYALSGSGRPMGVAQFKLTKAMPKELRVAAASLARLTAVVNETCVEQTSKGE